MRAAIESPPRVDGRTASVLERQLVPTWTEQDLSIDEARTAHRGGARALRAKVVSLPGGSVALSDVLADTAGGLGVLILSGVVLVHTRAGRGEFGWLFGADDMLRPEMVEVPHISEARCRVLTPTRLAILDARFAARAGADPSAWDWVLSHTAHTTHWLLAKSVVASPPLVEERLLLLFEVLAERWGRVTPAGIRLDLPLTQSLLATLTGARRPTISLALKRLARQNLVVAQRGRRFLLNPPG